MTRVTGDWNFTNFDARLRYFGLVGINSSPDFPCIENENHNLSRTNSTASSIASIKSKIRSLLV